MCIHVLDGFVFLRVRVRVNLANPNMHRGWPQSARLGFLFLWKAGLLWVSLFSFRSETDWRGFLFLAHDVLLLRLPINSNISTYEIKSQGKNNTKERWFSKILFHSAHDILDPFMWTALLQWSGLVFSQTYPMDVFSWGCLLHPAGVWLSPTLFYSCNWLTEEWAWLRWEVYQPSPYILLQKLLTAQAQ